MPRETERRPTKLDPQDRRTLEEQAEALKEQLHNIHTGDTETAKTLDSGLIQRQLAKKESALERDDRLLPKGVQKDRLAAEARDLEKELTENMPTKNEMWAKSGTVEMERAVRHQMEFETKHGDKVRRWKEIQNLLEPEDTLAANVECIRPERRQNE